MDAQALVRGRLYALRPHFPPTCQRDSPRQRTGNHPQLPSHRSFGLLQHQLLQHPVSPSTLSTAGSARIPARQAVEVRETSICPEKAL